MHKKVMWLCNTPLPELRKELGVKISGEGWLQGISDQLRRREDIEFHYVFPQKKRRGIFGKYVNHIYFWGFSDTGRNRHELSRQREKQISQIIEKIQPDIIHIFGTEFAHSLECIRSVSDKDKVVVSIQGLVSEIAKVYTKKIPIWEQALSAGCSNSLWKAEYDFYRRGINEKDVLSSIQNVIGRTTWDKRCVKKWNSDCRYFYCCETLREPFYEGKWNIRHVERHAIYISQANYPIKGFHVFLEAFSKVLQSFPDSYVYVAGDNAFLQSGDGYGNYINRLIKKYGVKNKIRFLGILPAEKVKEKLLNVHLTVMPSLLENSPNSIGEAMMLGTPVIAAKVGGIPSMVRNGKEALLYADHNAERLAECIRQIFTNDERALELSANGRNRAEQLYDRATNLENLLRIYETMGKKNRGMGATSEQ